MKTPARVLGFLFASVVVFLAGSGAAWADEPVCAAWPDTPARSLLDTLILFGGGTVGLFALVALFGLLTARNNYVPPAPSTEIEKASDNSPAAHH